MNKQPQTIGVFAPSSWVENNDIAKAQNFIEEQGYSVYIHPQTFTRYHQSAGTNKEKRQAFLELWNHPDIDLIWAAGGGNRCLHWIDDLDYTALKNSQPKAVLGFSDATALLNALFAYNGFQGFHAPTFNRLPNNPQISSLFRLMNGQQDHYSFNHITILNEGEAAGHLIGGNLSLFQYLPQTLPNNFWKGGILFLEDCNEELSRIDRMLLHLKRLGVFNDVHGIMFGQFGDLPDSGKPFGFTLEDIVKEHIGGLDIPVLMNAPFGHGIDLYSFPLGKKVQFSTKSPHLKF